MKYVPAIAVLSALVLSLTAATVYAQEYNFHVGGQGAGSTTTESFQSDTNTQQHQSNTYTGTNDVNNGANSGNNSANGNTNGGTVTSGDAVSNVNIINKGNINQSNQSCCGTPTPKPTTPGGKPTPTAPPTGGGGDGDGGNGGGGNGGGAGGGGNAAGGIGGGEVLGLAATDSDGTQTKLIYALGTLCLGIGCALVLRKPISG